MEYWLAGRFADAQSALSRARGVNPFVERYLIGTRRIPERVESVYRPGDESEAQVAAVELSPACRALPDFTVWLRKQG
jgi:hypothetical protein